MILGFVCFLLSLLGIYGFYNDIYILTYFAFIFSLFENILGRLNGSSKTLMPFIIFCIIGVFFTKNFWLGLSIGACFETIITFIGGIILIVYFNILIKKNKEDKNIYKNVEPEIPDIETIKEVNDYIENKKHDLDSLEENAPEKDREL